jgi:hypothetical protein
MGAGAVSQQTGTVSRHALLQARTRQFPGGNRRRANDAYADPHTAEKYVTSMGKTSIVGLDVRLSVATYLTETLGPRFTPPPLLTEMVQRGQLGRKTGQGFYSW